MRCDDPSTAVLWWTGACLISYFTPLGVAIGFFAAMAVMMPVAAVASMFVAAAEKVGLSLSWDQSLRIIVLLTAFPFVGVLAGAAWAAFRGNTMARPLFAASAHLYGFAALFFVSGLKFGQAWPH
jgi:hypothetical protein